MTTTTEDDLTGEYRLDPTHTRIGFVARHAMVTRVHGSFERFRGHAHIDLTAPHRSTAQVDIEAESVTTGIEKRDAHLRTSDFLDVPHHQLMTYRSSDISRVDQATFHVVGDLSIRGITRPVTLEFVYQGMTTDEAGDVRLAFTGSAVISRRAWGVSWSAPVEAGGLVVADNVTLEIDACFVRAHSQRPLVRTAVGGAR